MSDKIKEALQKLDPANENHWTADGSARLETVKFNTGGTAVTREEIDTAFPGFNKTTAAAYFMEVGSGAAPAAPAPEGHTPPSEVKASGPDATGPVEQAADPAALGEDNGNRTGIDAEGNPSAVLEPGVDVDGKATADTDAHGNLIGVDANDVPSAVIVQAEGAVATNPELFNPVRSEPARAPGTSGLVAAGGLTASPRDDGAGAAPQASQPGDSTAADREAREAQFAEVAERVAGEDDVEALAEELEEVEEELANINRHLDDMNKAKDDFNKHADRIRGRMAQLKGSDSASTIQQYLASRKEALQLRGENKQTLKDSGLTLKKIAQAVSAAPIDQAMARKTARGGRRPTRV